MKQQGSQYFFHFQESQEANSSNKTWMKETPNPITSLLSLSKYQDKIARPAWATVLAYTISNSHMCISFLNLNFHGPAVSIYVEDYLSRKISSVEWSSSN